MPVSSDYGKLAEECYRLANEAKTETDRQACLDLMQNWLDAAARNELAASKLRAEAEAAASVSEREPGRLRPVPWRHRLLGLFRQGQRPPVDRPAER